MHHTGHGLAYITGPAKKRKHHIKMVKHAPGINLTSGVKKIHKLRHKKLVKSQG